MKATGLPVVLRLDGRPVIVLGEGEGADAKRRLLARAGAVPVGEDAAAPIAIVAIEEAEAALAAVARMRTRGILVNAVDRPAYCDFTLPAIVDRAPVLIAVATGGASAALAAALRQRLERLIPAGLGALAERLRESRAAIRTRWPDASQRRRALGAALEEGGALDPFSAAADAVPDWLAARGGEAADRQVAIRLRGGDPDMLMLGEARLLGQADRVFHRPDVPPAILARIRADAERIACVTAPADAGPGLSIDLGWEADRTD